MSTTAYRCTCCNLRQNQVGDDGFCPICRYHQSREIHQTVKRHQEHEEMLRQRLASASEWAERADDERKKFGQRMHWAWKSRARSIKVLRQISDLHELRSDGSCKCHLPKGCRIATLLDDRGIQLLIRRVDDYEAELQHRERLWREMQTTGDWNAWEDFMREAGADQSMQKGTANDV